MFRIPPPGGGGEIIKRFGEREGPKEKEGGKKEKGKLGENITVGSNKSLNMINKTQFNTTI